MANTSRVNGFRVVKHTTGAPYNGQTNLYYVASAADEILAGDPVKLSGSGDANGIPGADLCGVSDVPVGIVAGVLHSKFKPNGELTNGSTALDLPAMAQIAALGSGYILVADDPEVIMEVETSNGTPAAADIGQNASHARAASTTTTVSSTATLDIGTKNTTNTLNFRLLGFVQRPDNEIGASARVLVGFNRHQYKVGTGSTGV